MAKSKYKRIIKKVLINKSNNQLQLTIPNNCGINAGDLVKLIPFDNSKDIDDNIIKKVLVNKSVDQLSLTVPKTSGFKADELVEIIPLNVKPIDMKNYPIYERGDVYENEEGKLVPKQRKGEEKNGQ